ncbi:penicillin acylase family protein [Pseudoxanthomonas sp. SGD-10]|nr:penicillin acylase family protein [Pseudoxanthomonas sp. SGD-10]
MRRWLLRAACALPLVLLALAAAAWLLLRGSLPRLEGSMALPGLAAPATVQRDALGIVTIDAASAGDAARALGYVHAQERFFEMDLLRRAAAGELAGLFGPRALDTDRRRRIHRLRARVEARLDAFAGTRMSQLQAYTEGVNAGLEALPVRPWPYLLLRQPPRPWQPADTALAGYAMYFDLQDAENRRELALWRLGRRLPAPLRELLLHDGSQWDAPLLAQPRGDAALPDAAAVDLRRLPAPPAAGQPLHEPASPGSNNWAVGAALTTDGRAIVADDMHLGLRAPNLWFRVRLRYPDPAAPGGRVDVSGFSLPGLPAVVVGSNGHVAWGFTNAYADTADWFPVRPCGEGQAQDCDPVARHVETIRVAGGDDVQLEIRETAAGPLVHADIDGQALALRWVAHLPGALNLGLAGFAYAADLDQALAIADQAAIPAQNLVIADRHGAIAWRILGPLPARAPGCTGLRPDGSTATCTPWPLASASVPVLRDPPGQRLWTANARTLDGEALARVGDGGYALGIRAWQIRERLHAADRFDEQALLAMQLDDRALLLEPWHDLLLGEARRAPAGSALRALADAGGDWNGHAAPESVAYRLVRAWRLAVHARIARGLAAPALARLGPEFELPALPQLEGVAWPLLRQRPPHLLPAGFDSWEALLEDAAAEVRDALAAAGPLAARRWGEENTARICHPLSAAVPALLARRLCMPADELRGDRIVPRVAAPAFGASQRMVVAPGREQDGLAHMPGGQGGHPLSPFRGAGHDDWVHGRPTPFLPGPARYTLTLRPVAARE